ncbi:uncharacterized protein LOC133904783 [Phragmites australis]|uniref:uncharacterized protein LOC133904783 n=1 Tax=Phragmites australis TaxID=29695 RepID=UPI002D797C8B|nr:uncharacterized protein LOC133904783 [Phragmites australis]
MTGVTDNKSSIALLLALLLTLLLWLVQVVVFSVVLCPLAVLYVLGIYISTGVSLWRLIENYYGNDNGGANLKPALNVLYSLAVAQGLLFGYMAVYGCGSRIVLLAKVVAKDYSLDLNIVCDYLDETVTGCKKDLSFAKGRNLVTYALDLMTESESNEGYLSGLRILGTCTTSDEGQEVLVKQLLTGSTYFNHMIQRLLETLGPRSPYSREIRAQAARVVAHVAGAIYLEQFPRGIQCISSLLNTFEEYSWLPMSYERHHRLPKTYEPDWFLEKYEWCYLIRTSGHERQESVPMEGDNDRFHGYQELVVQGLRILQKLTVDQENCRVMTNTKGLLSKIMAPLISSKIHRDRHDEWCSMAEESLELMSRLMADPGETGTTKLQHEISSNSKAITSTLEGILGCDNCEPKLQGQVVEMLLDLSVDTSSIVASGSSSTIFIRTLLDLFLWGMRRVSVKPPSKSSPLWEEVQSRRICSYYNASPIHWLKKRSYIQDLAGEKLQSMLSSQSETNATIILQAGGDVVGCLTRATVDAKSKTNRMRAAEILERLCSHYTKDDEYLKELKKSMTGVMTKVLREILAKPTESDIQDVSEANNAMYSAPGADLEKDHAVEDDDNGQRNTTASHQQNCDQLQEIKLKEALVCLCETVCNKLISADTDLAGQFDEIAAHIYSEQRNPDKTFSSLIKEARELLDKKKAQELAIVSATSSREIRWN